MCIRDSTKLNCNGIFDVQVKRLHEYKRQQLNAMNIIADYIYLLNNCLLYTSVLNIRPTSAVERYMNE